ALGTLVAHPETDDWVAYTPEGHFDSSPGGERFVTWASTDGSILPLDAFADRLRRFRLTDELRRGIHPRETVASLFPEPAPRLAIESSETETVEREVELTVTLDDP